MVKAFHRMLNNYCLIWVRIIAVTKTDVKWCPVLIQHNLHDFFSEPIMPSV